MTMKCNAASMYEKVEPWRMMSKEVAVGTTVVDLTIANTAGCCAVRKTE